MPRHARRIPSVAVTHPASFRPLRASSCAYKAPWRVIRPLERKALQARHFAQADYVAAYSLCIHSARTCRAHAHLPLLSAGSTCTKSAG